MMAPDPPSVTTSTMTLSLSNRPHALTLPMFSFLGVLKSFRSFHQITSKSGRLFGCLHPLPWLHRRRLQFTPITYRPRKLLHRQTILVVSKIGQVAWPSLWPRLISLSSTKHLWRGKSLILTRHWSPSIVRQNETKTMTRQMHMKTGLCLVHALKPFYPAHWSLALTWSFLQRLHCCLHRRWFHLHLRHRHETKRVDLGLR